MDPTTTLARELALCRAAANPYDRFNSVVLQRGDYWSRQRQVCRAMADPSVRRVLVRAGHMVGKSHLAAGVALAWLTMFEDSGVVVLGPSLEQVRRAVFKEIRKARAGSPLLRHAGKMSRSPMQLEYDDGWLVVGLSGTEPERLQGFHPRGPVLAGAPADSGIHCLFHNSSSDVEGG